MSDEHFTVDGTLLEACAGLKSFKRKEADEPAPPDDPANPTIDFHGEKRSNDTHCSTTDPEARLARKGRGKEAKLSYNGNVLMETRNGLVADVQVLPATGRAEREGALMMIGSREGAEAVTVGADKGYDTKEFVAECREMKATPHVAQKARTVRLTDRRRGTLVMQPACRSTLFNPLLTGTKINDFVFNAQGETAAVNRAELHL